MNRQAVEKLARTILHEGYVLYPYRPSVKTRQRWTFGGIYPKAWSDAQKGTDAWTIQTECLIRSTGDGKDGAEIEVSIGFLHLLDRTIGSLPNALENLPSADELTYAQAESLKVGERQYTPWQEAVERRVEAGRHTLKELEDNPRRIPFSFERSRAWEAIRGAGGEVVGVIIRQQEAISGQVEVSSAKAEEGVSKITVRVFNHTGLMEGATRDDALMRSLVSTHIVLGTERGQFISAIDPPGELRRLAQSCQNIGVWPVLVGEGTETDTMLCSPIILYDYPQVAPESPGDLFDGTEIDEILTLRILTLTDEEKRAAAGNDERVREMMSRTESLAREHLMGLHGVFRPVEPASAGEEHRG